MRESIQKEKVYKEKKVYKMTKSEWLDKKYRMFFTTKKAIL